MNKEKFIIVLLFMCSLNLMGQKIRYRYTFKNYRVAIGGGLGYSPIMLFNPAPYNLAPWKAAKPSIKLELITGPRVAFNFGCQLEQYKFNISPEVELYDVHNFGRFFAKINTKARARNLAFTFDFRRYSTYHGYIAPVGRYMTYGLSLNTMTTLVDSYTFKFNDQINGTTTYFKPETKVVLKPIYGIRFGYGKKRYLGQKLKTFLEYQLLFDLKMGYFGKG
ncbi:MAG: hypothetical protein PSX81_08065, partial [bacterium]|nr:hypothetical protein [bacterium]